LSPPPASPWFAGRTDPYVIQPTTFDPSAPPIGAASAEPTFAQLRRVPAKSGALGYWETTPRTASPVGVVRGRDLDAL